MRKTPKIFIYFLVLTASSYISAECTVSQSEVARLASTGSIDLYDKGVSRSTFNSGLSCVGLLAISNMAYIKYKVEAYSNILKSSNSSDVLRISVKDSSNNTVTSTAEYDLSTYDFMSFFSGPDNSIPFYLSASSGQMISPGIYKSSRTFDVRWYYSVPKFAAGGMGSFYESPGFRRPVFGVRKKWGDGRVSKTILEITVTADCRISSNNVDFGIAPFASEFEPVQTSMGIRCAVKTPYTVGLSDGQYPLNNHRRMKAANSNNFINYDIYKNSSLQRWGATGTQRWSSLDATINPGLDDGIKQQGYSFRTEVLKDNSNSLPAGVYSDNISIEVKF